MTSYILQYVDNILLSAMDHTVCTQGCLALLNHLVHCGFKVSLSKLQFCQTLVHYLGFFISQGECRLSSDRLKVIVEASPPTMQKGMLSFRGLINYCRHDCSHHEKVFRQCCLKGQPHTIEWTKKMMHSFFYLKQSLSSAPALGLPDYISAFHLYVSEDGSTAAGVLTQEHSCLLHKKYSIYTLFFLNKERPCHMNCVCVSFGNSPLSRKCPACRQISLLLSFYSPRNDSSD